ncbi:MAG: NAD(P)-dependent oxidoreductase, partial [Candidatus Omnitrophica bacterium]|nr:NAD(P)-dependent oxidoreductase [Candidatus Omnitrophota bacterium]MDD5738290.1 NAD(P)-dependent oxidoreductase [Candidatus Omnitrophota bacterium]
ICKELDIAMVYISTGAVFDGEKEGGYKETDKPNPISIYGMSKLKGEESVRSLLKKYFIVRAGWMIGGHNKDKKFVWKIVQLLNTKKEISVVTDKTGSPTFTTDFSKGIVDIVKSGKYGLYHCVNKGICTRYDIAVKIAEYLGRKDVVIKPVTSDAFPLPAPRGRSEAMLNSNLSKLGLDKTRPWQDALKEYLKALK